MEYSEILLNLFREKEAFLEGHFQLSSGLHSPNYMQCARLLQYPWIAAELGERIANQLRADGIEIDLILSPALGGVIIGHEVARSLHVPFIFSERESNEMKLRRGFQVLPNQKVVVVEDVVTTGKSTRETMDVAIAYGGKIVGVAAIVDRSVSPINFDAPFHSLLKLPLTTYPPELCRLCKHGIAIVKPGSRRS